MLFHMKRFEKNTEIAEYYVATHTHNFYRERISISVLGEMQPSPSFRAARVARY